MAVLGGIAAAIHIGKVPPAIPLLRDEFALSLVQAGWIMGLASALGATCGFLVGRLTDALTHRRAMVLGLALTVLGSLLGAAAPGATMLMASRVLESIGIILTIVAGPALVSSSSDPGDRQLALGIWALMMLLSPALLGVWGWRGSWLVASLIGLVPLIALLVLNIPRQPADQAPTPVLEGLRMTASRATSWLIAGIFLAYSASFMAVFGFLPTMLVEDMQVSLNHASVLTACAVLSNAAGNVLGGVLARWGAARWQMIALPFILLTLSAYLVFSPSLPLSLRYGASIFYAVSGGVLPATVMGSLPVYAPRRDLVGTFSGFVMQGSNIGQCFGPMLLASLVALRGWPAAPYYITSMTGLGLILALVLRKVEGDRRGASRA
jgi:predicted MFS family arabinose efflux permease